MPRVICTLPNASELINNVEFKETAEGMLSVEISDEIAANFAKIPGYAIVAEEGKKTVKVAAEPENIPPVGADTLFDAPTPPGAGLTEPSSTEPAAGAPEAGDAADAGQTSQQADGAAEGAAPVADAPAAAPAADKPAAADKPTKAKK